MQSTEAAAQAAISSLEFSLDGFSIVSSGKKTAKYDPLYDLVPKMQVGKLYRVTTELGYNTERSAKHNKTNILSCLGKNEALKGYQFAGIVATNGTEEVFVIKLLKRPAETAPIPVNLEKEGGISELPTEEA